MHAGKFGPYLKWNGVNASLPKNMDPESLTLQAAIDLINTKTSKSTVINLGEHPQKKGTVEIRTGEFGPYVKWNRINASIPKNINTKDVTMELALKLIEKKIKDRK